MVINLLEPFEKGLKRVVGFVGYQLSGGKSGRIQEERMRKTPEGRKFLEEYEESPEGKLRRKIWNWTKSR